jgi:DNA-binding beta-propeller fold protein YncE
MRFCKNICWLIPVLFLAIPVFAQDAPAINYDSVPNFLKLPPALYMGEAAGVATNSKGHIFVFTRSGETRLFEFDKDGNFVREIAAHLYAWAFAHVVRVDAQDNIWAVDEGSNMIIKFNPEGKVVMTLGRKPESAEGDTPGGFNYHPPVPGAPEPLAQPGSFRRPTDVAWDAAGNIFVSDGYGNSRVAKYDKDGRFIKSVGTVKGKEPGQFSTPHTIATDRQGDVYVGDRGNSRIQVFDNDLKLRAIWTGIGAPWAICITPGSKQYLYTSDAAGPIYKMNMEGQVVGKFGAAGKQMKQFGWIHEIDCRTDNELIVAELLNWRVQKLILHPETEVSKN